MQLQIDKAVWLAPAVVFSSSLLKKAYGLPLAWNVNYHKGVDTVVEWVSEWVSQQVHDLLLILYLTSS